MRGKNPIRAQDLTDGSQLLVQDIFLTLQGEGPFAGKPAVFVRLWGCNLRCYFCDTDFESNQSLVNLDQILEKVDSLAKEVTNPAGLVVITGGEPFRQNIAPLVKKLSERGLEIQIETNGTLWVELPDTPSLSIVCSPKTERLHEEIVPRISAYKYVLEADCVDNEDGLPFVSSQLEGRRARIARPTGNAEVYVMPLDSFSEEKNRLNRRACVEISQKFGYRLTLQLHKILGIP